MSEGGPHDLSGLGRSIDDVAQKLSLSRDAMPSYGQSELRLDHVDASLSEIKATLRRMEDNARRMEDNALSRWDIAWVSLLVLGAACAAVGWAIYFSSGSLDAALEWGFGLLSDTPASRAAPPF